MSTGGTESATVPLSLGAVILIVCSCLAAAMALVNLAASVFALNFDMVVSSGFAPSRSALDQLLIMIGGGALATVVALVVIHLARRDGWPWLLVAGTILVSAIWLPDPMMPTVKEILDNELFIAALGAGPVLVVTGLLGAGNLLMHATPRGIGPVIAGAALAAPLLGGVVLGLWLRNLANPAAYGGIRTMHAVLAGVSITGAIGAAAMSPLLRRLPVPDRPATRVTVVGAIAGVLAVAPPFVIKAADWSPVAPNLPNPEDAFQVPVDDWSRLFGLTGLMIFVVAVGLAFVLNSKALGAALAAGLVLYGIDTSMAHAAGSISDPVVALILALVGFALGGLAAATRWRSWFAGASCSVLGIATIVVVLSGVEPPPNQYPVFSLASMPRALAVVLLPLILFAAVTAIATVAAELTAGTQAPAVVGAVAVAIQVGLLDSGVLLGHSDIAGRSRWMVDGVSVAAGIALLLGAALVVALRFVRTTRPADPLPPEQPTPALTPG